VIVAGFVSLKSLATGAQRSPSVYSAPEQQQGQVTIAADLFALGPTLLYLLTGKDPAEFSTQQEQGSHFNLQSVPGLTPDVAAIIDKLTQPQPGDRYTSAREVAEILTQI
jgi:serine/threonine-protein kinase